MTSTEVRELPIGDKSLWEAFHVPTQRRIGVCLSKDGAETLIKAGSMFMTWDTLTAEEAEAIKGGPELLEHFAGCCGLTKRIVTDNGDAMWFTEADLELLEAING